MFQAQQNTKWLQDPPEGDQAASACHWGKSRLILQPQAPVWSLLFVRRHYLSAAANSDQNSKIRYKGDDAKALILEPQIIDSVVGGRSLTLRSPRSPEVSLSSFLGFKKKKHKKMKKNKGKSIDKFHTPFKGDGKFAKIFWAPTIDYITYCTGTIPVPIVIVIHWC